LLVKSMVLIDVAMQEGIGNGRMNCYRLIS
jgi:hypothetical protein